MPRFIKHHSNILNWPHNTFSCIIYNNIDCNVFQITNLEQQVLESSEKLRSTEQQIREKQQHMDKLVSITAQLMQRASICRKQPYTQMFSGTIPAERSLF